MSKFNVRSSGVELMDDLDCSGEVVHQTLRELEFINRTLGGNSITVNGVGQLLDGNSIKSPQILDLGCGGGDMLLLLKRKLKEHKHVKLHGIDANRNIIRYASEHISDDSISFSRLNILSDDFEKLQCDVAVATLFFHHFTDAQLVAILKKLKSHCRVGIVINDLHRHPLAYYSIKLLTKIFSKSTMVKFDAPLSVLRGFSKQEWIDILSKADITHYTLEWRWVFRWKIVIRTS